MADGGSSSSGGAAAGAGVAAGAAVSSGEAANTGAVSTEGNAGKSTEAKAGDEGTEAGIGVERAKVSKEVGEVIDGKPVTVTEVKEKSTINKDHVEGEEKVEKPVKEEVKKHKYAERLAKEYPGRTFETDEDHENAHEELVKSLIGYRDRGVVTNQKLVALFEAEPWVADMVSSMIAGQTGRAAIAKHFGAEDLVPEEGDPDYEAWDKNAKDRLERVEKTNKFNKEFNENLEFSQKSVDEFANENNLKPEEAEKIIGEFNDMLKDIFRGRITKETLTKIMRAVKHDEAVQEAKKEGLVEGEIKAKNEKIKATKEDASAKKGDGMPALKNSGDTIEEPENKPQGEQIIDRIFQKSKQRSNF